MSLNDSPYTFAYRKMCVSVLCPLELVFYYMSLTKSDVTFESLGQLIFTVTGQSELVNRKAEQQRHIATSSLYANSAQTFHNTSLCPHFSSKMMACSILEG